MDDETTLADIAEEHPNVYRECAGLFLRVLHHAVATMPDCPEKWGIAFATSNPVCMGRSMSDVARGIGISRATLSFVARKFCQETGLPPSSYMRSEEAVQTAHNARVAAVKRLARKIRTETKPLR